MKELTPRQQKILNTIIEFIEVKGYPPTVREIADIFRITEKGSYDHLCALRRKGRIDWSVGKSRTIRILKA